MIYAITLLDKQQSTELRQRARPKHKACLNAVADRIAFAGPFMTEDGMTMWPRKSGFSAGL